MMEVQESSHPNKNVFRLPLKKDGNLVTLSSQFDSGNMANAELGLNNALIITPAVDCSTLQLPNYSKGWFYFSVIGAPPHAKVKFIIKKMSPLSTLLKFSEYFRPVYRVSGEEWQRIEHAIVFTKQDDTELHFQFIFNKSTEVFFAYTYPFSYEECEKMLKNTQKQAKIIKNVYYKDEVMVRTLEGRSVHLLTVTSNDDKEQWKEQRLSQYLFCDGDRPVEFKSSKRVVLISARVHPGETPSSHTFNGLLKFILSNDARAHYLRKNFVFKLVPMLNPDGVYHGHYRMDTLGQNLNRFYHEPDLYRQPAVYAMRLLGQHYCKSKRLCFYIDLHAHPQKKGNFIYGNALDNPQEQVETQLFARLLSLNCPEFDYFSSSFSKYHMNAKDKNEDLTKQGCGRVVFNTHFQTLYSYTMECGYTSSTYLNEITPIQNAHRKFDKCSIISDELQNLKSPYYSSGKKNTYFTIRSYENLGKNILVSILDLFQLNPASRIPTTSMKDLNGVRKEISDHISKMALAYSNKVVRTPPILGSIKPIKSLTGKQLGRKYLVRAPSIESSKQMNFNKLRNRTIAKVNICLS